MLAITSTKFWTQDKSNLGCWRYFLQSEQEKCNFLTTRKVWSHWTASELGISCVDQTTKWLGIIKVTVCVDLHNTSPPLNEQVSILYYPLYVPL